MNPSTNTSKNDEQKPYANTNLDQRDQEEYNNDMNEEASSNDDNRHIIHESFWKVQHSECKECQVDENIQLDGRIPIIILKSIQDLSQPKSALECMRLIAGDHGTILVLDSTYDGRLDDAAHSHSIGNRITNTSPQNDPDMMIMYGFSCTCCWLGSHNELNRRRSLASSENNYNNNNNNNDSFQHADTASSCSVSLREYANKIGFRDIEILPVRHPFLRFYKLYAG